MIYFDDIEILVNGTGILADTFSISSENSLLPIYSLGRKGISQQPPDGPIKNVFRMSYYKKIDSDPPFDQVNTFKNNTNLTGFSGIQIVAGGLSGYYCYLTNYSLQASPNELIKANATFESFIPLSGSLRQKPSGVMDLSTISGTLGHGWTVHILSGNSYLTSPIYNFNYSFDVNWNPTYVLGHKYPLQIDFMTANERMNFDHETYHHINFTGELAASQASDALIPSFETGLNLDLLQYDFLCDSSTTPTSTISISGHRITQSDLNIKLDDFARTTTTVVNYF